MATASTRTTDEAQIREIVNATTKGILTRDVDAVMKNYAPDVVVFEMIPPLQYVGAEAFRKVWQGWFDMIEGPIEYEVRDLSITVGSDAAFSYSFNRITSRDRQGKASESWLRVSSGYQKINGRWLITHEHFSVPFDMQTSKALTDLAPGASAQA